MRIKHNRTSVSACETQLSLISPNCSWGKLKSYRGGFKLICFHLIIWKADGEIAPPGGERADGKRLHFSSSLSSPLLSYHWQERHTTHHVKCPRTRRILVIAFYCNRIRLQKGLNYGSQRRTSLSLRRHFRRYSFVFNYFVTRFAQGSDCRFLCKWKFVKVAFYF